MLSGCASHVSTPRAYLDEETAATITIVAEPWIFTGEQVGASLNDRDYLNMFAIDVNRMGDHRQYLAVLQSMPPTALASAGADTGIAGRRPDCPVAAHGGEPRASWASRSRWHRRTPRLRSGGISRWTSSCSARWCAQDLQATLVRTTNARLHTGAMAAKKLPN